MLINFVDATNDANTKPPPTLLSNFRYLRLGQLLASLFVNYNIAQYIILSTNHHEYYVGA